MAGEIESASLLGIPQVVFYWEEMDLPLLFRPGASIFSPWHQKSECIDIALEFATGSQRSRNALEAGMHFAETLIPEHEIRDYRERYWPQSARLVIGCLFAAASYRWKMKVKEGHHPADLATISYLMQQMLQDLSLIRGDSRGKKLPPWWHSIGDNIRYPLETLIIANATQTSGCLVSEALNYLSSIKRMLPEKGAEPYFALRKEPLFVGLKNLPEKAVSLFVAGLAANCPEAAVFAAEIDGWTERPRELLLRTFENYRDTLSLTATLSGDTIRKVDSLLSGNAIWGHSTSLSVKTLFSEAVKTTTGREGGTILSLAYEEPCALPTDLDAISFSPQEGWKEMRLDLLPATFPCVTLEEILGGRAISEKSSEIETFTESLRSICRNPRTDIIGKPGKTVSPTKTIKGGHAKKSPQSKMGPDAANSPNRKKELSLDIDFLDLDDAIFEPDDDDKIPRGEPVSKRKNTLKSIDPFDDDIDEDEND